MSILIKGMKMPKNCDECILWDADCACCLVPSVPFIDYFDATTRLADCPLIEVPTPHGRLKDEQELIKAINEKVDNVSENRGRGATIPSIAWFSGVSSALSIIEAAPVIIEAEKERDE